MVLKVDLQCSKCYKKVKKVLCKFPQIRDQVYDEKANTVTITVICCNPEKIRDKLCSKGGGFIKSIQIKPAAEPKEPEKPKEAEKPKDSGEEKAEKPKESGEKKVKKPKESGEKKAKKPKESGEKKAEKPKDSVEKKADEPKEAEKPKPKEGEEKKAEKPEEADKPKEAAAPPKVMEVTPLPPMAYAVGYSYMDGYGAAGPSYYYGEPSCYGRPVYDSWGLGGGGYNGYGYGGGRGGQCSSDENPQGCSIM
ncbi:hypothetical protein HRI_001423200 [Hibiscus trionum]|uniref:Uncharacterized protein n=1 Tax=Hibiscus trionum TaxID=183268 RepID=A0A9W7LUB0_HIBTR|nr:hypothetical protein HRI_001423200 [Hibiscus trionum]